MMMQKEVEKAPDVVTGTLSIDHKTAYVLLDPGATHAFVSNTFAMHMNRKLESLPDEMLVHKPVGNVVIIDHVYQECEVKIDTVVMTIDLLPLELDEFDAILGMNFLSKYHVTMDYFRKEMVFKKLGEAKIVFKGRRKILPTCLVCQQVKLER